MCMYTEVLYNYTMNRKREILIATEDGTRNMSEIVETMKVEDYIYSLYNRSLITFQQYVHKLRLIDEDDNVDLIDVSES